MTFSMLFYSLSVILVSSIKSNIQYNDRIVQNILVWQQFFGQKLVSFLWRLLSTVYLLAFVLSNTDIMVFHVFRGSQKQAKQKLKTTLRGNYRTDASQLISRKLGSMINTLNLEAGTGATNLCP